MVDIIKELETKTLSKILAENLAYYVEDPIRRCNTGTKCCYSPKNANKENLSEGCFIGRFLLPKQQEKLDQYELSWSDTLIDKYSRENKGFNDLPQTLLENVDLFKQFQAIHDVPDTINNPIYLKRKLNDILLKFSILDEQDFKQFLV